ncbi:hypothetical protein Cme02nite_10770 [Catellatospora methionotrophica]|uniref:DUF3097 domain-containing protein n=2 Tax=Catellatospora methionotrophica TaxID=121620 RepID=A0A8J3LDW9_9ACTN|nr:DUF3097 domain-containing protein [Catellatospora methionotrophica]GIG12745.1 hypothetical protein Cme02nite_10770 [Catellatospora methionotrophica]
MRYSDDVLDSFDRRKPHRVTPEHDAELGMVVEDAGSGFCGEIVGFEYGAVTLEDRHGRRRHFPLEPAAFLLDGTVVTLRRPQPSATPARPRRTASGSVAAAPTRAQVARAGRIWVEGLHDAELLERIWGDDLRGEAIVVEPLHGVDDLPAAVREFAPGPGRRLGVLVDHLVSGTKEARLAQAVDSPHCLIAGHPYVDVWQAVKPSRLGMEEWPVVPRGHPWKEGICAALGVGEPALFWRRLLSRVDSYHDLETPLVNSVERLIDFVTAPQE